MVNVSMAMTTRSITASRFKAQCLALLDRVAESGEEIILTKRGRPVAKLTSLSQPKELAGSVTFKVPDEELLEPLDTTWDAAR